MHYALTFLASDPDFQQNLSYMRNWRIDNHLFANDCTVIVDGRARDCSTCFVRPDPKFFEFDGHRVEIERVSRVEYRLPKLPALYAMREALDALNVAEVLITQDIIRDDLGCPDKVRHAIETLRKEITC